MIPMIPSVQATTPAIIVRPVDSPRFSTFRAPAGRHALLLAASKVGSPLARATVANLIQHYQDAPLPENVADRIHSLAPDVADLLDCWTDNSAYHRAEGDKLSLYMLQWAGNKLAALGAIDPSIACPILD